MFISNSNLSNCDILSFPKEMNMEEDAYLPAPLLMNMGEGEEEGEDDTETVVDTHRIHTNSWKNSNKWDEYNNKGFIGKHTINCSYSLSKFLARSRYMAIMQEIREVLLLIFFYWFICIYQKIKCYLIQEGVFSNGDSVIRLEIEYIPFILTLYTIITRHAWIIISYYARKHPRNPFS